MRYEEYIKSILDDYVNNGRIQAKDFPIWNCIWIRRLCI